MATKSAKSVYFTQSCSSRGCLLSHIHINVFYLIPPLYICSYLFLCL